MLGDIAYENGSDSDFANCFEPSWGKLVPRIRAALGNHEYNTAGAAPAIKLFGCRRTAGTATRSAPGT